MSELVRAYQHKVAEVLAHITADIADLRLPEDCELQQTLRTVARDIQFMHALSPEDLDSALVCQRYQIARIRILYLQVTGRTD
jgi:hypothetical protein